MRPRGFIEDWRPRQKSLDLLAKVEAIIAEYAMPLTIRQIFYRLVGRHGYDKTEQAYDNLGELLTKARRAQRISMEAIRDDGFVNHHPQCFASAGHFMTTVRKAAESLTLDYQKGQPRRLVAMCEAAGMAPQLYRVTEPYGIAVMSAGGFDSLTDKHRLAYDWAAHGGHRCLRQVLRRRCRVRSGRHHTGAGAAARAALRSTVNIDTLNGRAELRGAATAGARREGATAP